MPLYILGFALFAWLGYWLAKTAAPVDGASGGAVMTAEAEKPREVVENEVRRTQIVARERSQEMDLEAAMAGAYEGQRVLVFKDQDALEAFLRRAGSGISVLGRLDALNSLRVGFSDYDDLAGLLDGDEEEYLLFPVITPIPGEGSVQAGAVGLGNQLLQWLGVDGDNSGWGSGVTVAILDTGVASHSAFGADIEWLNLVDLPADLTELNGHGTAVASVIIGESSLTPGVAPETDILSIRIADDSGTSNSYLLAEGIVAAVDAGVDLINISMASLGDSGIVQKAVEYALEQGVLIVAASGNNGTDQVSYPAAYDGVVAVGAVDGVNDYLEFSNYGEEIDIAAAGLEVYVAQPDEQGASVSGTSFSSPIVAGAISAIMSEEGVSATQAWDLLTDYLNDGGAEGEDAELGGGTPDLWRVFNGDTAGIYDAAVASQRIIDASATYPYGQVEVLVQNQGTETLINTTVTIDTGGGTEAVNITQLAPNGTETVLVPVTSLDSDLTVRSQVTTGDGQEDARTTNNVRINTYAGTGAE
ncbi:MAG: S8 family peptidase [Verrucomicrobiota bacterium JB025]|nr:S8 family serine peptidase [Verrucomicrobiota bacterium JB025]